MLQENMSGVLRAFGFRKELRMHVGRNASTVVDEIRFEVLYLLETVLFRLAGGRQNCFISTYVVAGSLHKSSRRDGVRGQMMGTNP